MNEHDQALREALEKAIYREIGARDFYGSVAGTITNPEGRDRFRHLSEDEEAHRAKLVGWLEERLGVRFVFDDAKGAASEIQGIELSAQTGAFEALKLAIEAETNAEAYYRRQAAAFDDAELEKLLLEIADEESGHRSLLEAELNSLRGGFYWFDMDSSSFLED
ncbi:MAG: ferritin family protein [Candidatus Krumholzibacteriota bacterium]|nr:ferritin family protein [Candidatus Krumholzibacteriota bacterium]